MGANTSNKVTTTAVTKAIRAITSTSSSAALSSATSPFKVLCTLVPSPLEERMLLRDSNSSRCDNGNTWFLHSSKTTNLLLPSTLSEAVPTSTVFVDLLSDSFAGMFYFYIDK